MSREMSGGLEGLLRRGGGQFSPKKTVSLDAGEVIMTSGIRISADAGLGARLSVQKEGPCAIVGECPSRS